LVLEENFRDLFLVETKTTTKIPWRSFQLIGQSADNEAIKFKQTNTIFYYYNVFPITLPFLNRECYQLVPVRLRIVQISRTYSRFNIFEYFYVPQHLFVLNPRIVANLKQYFELGGVLHLHELELNAIFAYNDSTAWRISSVPCILASLPKAKSSC